MTLHDFLNTHDGDECISIGGYCDGWHQESIMSAPWYRSVRDKKIKRWQINGGGIYALEFFIILEN